MNRVAAAIMAGVMLTAACTRDTGPPVVISDLRVIAPVPGSNAGVAYLTITNNSGNAITVTGARSPQFDKVEIHETSIVDGVSRMRRLDSVRIDSGRDAVFASGGKHFMLMGARQDTHAGATVTLEIEYDDGLLIVSATMQSRSQAE